MLNRLALAAALCLSACSPSDEISIQVYPATPAGDASAPPEVGERVDYAGSPHSAAGRFDVGAESLITEWSIVAFKAALQPDGSRAVVARLNAYGQKQMGEFTADIDSERKFVAVKVDGRWADVGPLLSPVGDRITLCGFTQEETERLGRSIANR